ncbi:MAG TPA: GntR family transcriptional regulator [Solirubrobacteraceae bacterium]|jgi:DNA-binding GntR family transcriptional regulator
MTKQERVYEAIRGRILDGAYAPGERVVIDEVAEEFKVSGMPVREAMRRLEAEGLVVYRPNAGPRVTPVDPRRFDEEMTVLAVLDGYATALAASRLREVAIVRLTQINAEMEDAVSEFDTRRFAHLNQDFHALVYHHCPSAALALMLPDLTRRVDAVRRTIFAEVPYRGSAAVAEHWALIEMIASETSFDQIERAAREHKLSTACSLRGFRGARAVPLRGRRAAGPARPASSSPQGR